MSFSLQPCGSSLKMHLPPVSDHNSIIWLPLSEIDCQNSFVFLAPADYMGISVDRNFTIGTGLPGQTRFCQNIDINDDNLAEGLEEFTYRLVSLNSELVEVNPSRSTANIQILDDDGKSAQIVGVHANKEFTANYLQLLYDWCSEGSHALHLNVIKDILFHMFYILIFRAKFWGWLEYLIKMSINSTHNRFFIWVVKRKLIYDCFVDVVFELEQLVYDTTEGGIPMVMVCVNLLSGILVSRSITVDVAPKAFDPLVDTATSKKFWSS